MRRSPEAIGKQPLKVLRPPNQPEGISRRDLLTKIVPAAVLTAVGIGVEAKTGVIRRGLGAVAELAEGGPTDKQRTAAHFWKISGENDFVHNIEAVGATDEKGNVIPVKLRNKPELKSWGREGEGKIIGKINPPFSIDKALVVRGDDLKGIKDEGLWFIILNPKNPDPNDPNNFFFAEHGGFKYNAEKFVEVPHRSLDDAGLSITSQ